MIGAEIGQTKYLADAAEEKKINKYDKQCREKRLQRVNNIKQA